MAPAFSTVEPGKQAAAPGRGGRPLRVAVVSYRLPLEGERRGGVDRVAHDLAHGLALRGHEVAVWTYDRKPAAAAYRVRPLPWGLLFHSWLGMRLIGGYLGNVLALLPRYGDVDAIVAMGDSLLLPLRGIPVVRTVHGSALGEALSASSPWRIAMQLGVYAQELLTAMLHGGCVAVSEGTRRHNPFVRRTIPNGVDLSSFSPNPSARTPAPSLLFVGTLDGRKRGALLLQWFQEVIRPRVPEATLTIVGPQGPPVEGVEYRTGVSQAELAREYRRAWVYASPSAYEGFGLPYVEAMASGTPVVATPNPGSREVLADGEYGLLPQDESFAQVLVELLGDAERRRAMAARGLERASHYSLESMVDAYEALLRELTSGRPLPSQR